MSQGLFRALALVAMIVGIGKIFRFCAWRMDSEAESPHWTKHWHRHHGPRPPWFSHREKWSEDTESDTEAGLDG